MVFFGILVDQGRGVFIGSDVLGWTFERWHVSLGNVNRREKETRVEREQRERERDRKITLVGEREKERERDRERERERDRERNRENIMRAASRAITIQCDSITSPLSTGGHDNLSLSLTVICLKNASTMPLDPNCGKLSG